MTNSITTTQFINRHKTSIKRRKLLRLEQLHDRLSKKHRTSVNQFMVSDDEQRTEIVKALISDPKFVSHQEMQFFRNTDGRHLLQLDHDKYSGAFGISRRLVEQIITNLDNGTKPTGWHSHSLHDDWLNKRFRKVYRLTPNNKFDVKISLGNRYRSSALHNCRIDFNPNLISARQQQVFWLWLFQQFGSELEAAMEDSLLLANDVGLQWHGIASFMLNFELQAHRYRHYPEHSSKAGTKPFIASTYAEIGRVMGDELSNDTCKVYCPLRALLERDGRPQRLLANKKKKLLDGICVSTRFEQSWLYSANSEIALKFNQVSAVPCNINHVAFISPAIFSYLTPNQGLKLAQHKYPKVMDYLTNTEYSIMEEAIDICSVSLGEAHLRQLRQELHDRFMQPINVALKRIAAVAHLK